MKAYTDVSKKIFDSSGYIIITLISTACFLPFLLLISASFTDESSIIKHGFSLIPGKFSIDAYQYVFRQSAFIWKAYLITISLVVFGTAIHLLFNTMGAYALSRRDFKYRNYVAFYLYFTTMFGGGLVPWYILCVRYLHLKNTYFVLLQAGLVSVFNLLIMRNFIKQIPESIIESAKIDGAGEFRILLQLIVPMSVSSLVTIWLLVTLGYWNDWYMASLFINNANLYPLQYLLYSIINNAEFLASAMGRGLQLPSTRTIPRESVKMATAVIVTGPIIFMYPFVQKYFVKGLVIGAVKG